MFDIVFKRIKSVFNNQKIHLKKNTFKNLKSLKIIKTHFLQNEIFAQKLYFT